MLHKLISVLLCISLLFSLSGCGAKPAEQPAETVSGTPEKPVSAASLNSYSATAEEAAAAADTVVATMNDAALTNGLLQVYYWLEVAAYRMADKEPAPDFSQPLDTQPCSMDSSISWQEYFLREALNTWTAQQALVLKSRDEGVPTEEEYKPDLAKRQEYMTGMPANQYLYAWSEGYIPNEQHQAYLDSIPGVLRKQAREAGFKGNRALVNGIAGPGAAFSDLIAYADLANRAYMYFTEMGYHFEPSAEEIEAYCQAHQSDLPSGGDKTVDIRHILLIPANAEIAADGTVTASEDAWNRCLTEATNLVNTWKKEIGRRKYSQFTTADVAETEFAELAKGSSADPGSSINGGLYVDISKGQLAPELDTWCFDDARQHGDYEIIRSACGYHIVFFAGSTADYQAAAVAAMTEQYYADLMNSALENYKADVNYDAIKLGQAPDNGASVTIDHLLYPDIAHQRFPKMPLYLQQDYPDAPFGNYKLSTHGCGITTLAMVASYLADDELTPVELAARFGYYCGLRGSEIVLFDDTPAEMGFFLQNRSYSWPQMNEALRNGQVVVSLQWAGYWTRGGHYIAMTELTDEGRYVVRDSNLLNYKRITAHQSDNHSQNSISEAGQYYWIYDKKVTSIPTCVRCGGDAAGAPEVMFHADYLCAKCHTATERRNLFLSSPAA